MTLTIYHSPMMRSLRIVWLLEEMGITDYKLNLIPREEVYKYAKSSEYQAINPLAKFPAMTDGDLTMVESTAIMEYLLDKYGDNGLVPKTGTDDYGRYLQWLHFGEASMGFYAVVLMLNINRFPEAGRSVMQAEWARSEIQNCLEFLAPTLEKQDWLCEHGFSAADVSVSYTIYLLKLIKAFGDAPDPVKAYWERIKSRPAWEKTSRLK